MREQTGEINSTAMNGRCLRHQPDLNLRATLTANMKRIHGRGREACVRIRERCPCRRGWGRRGRIGRRRRGCGASSGSWTRGSRGRRSTPRSTGSCALPSRHPSSPSPRWLCSSATDGEPYAAAANLVGDGASATLQCNLCKGPPRPPLERLCSDSYR